MGLYVCVCLTGYWSLTVYGRKHCYRLFTKHYNEAVHWACAVQKVIDSKAPFDTPTQLLIRDIEVREQAATKMNMTTFINRDCKCYMHTWA